MSLHGMNVLARVFVASGEVCQPFPRPPRCEGTSARVGSEPPAQLPLLLPVWRGREK